MPVLDVTLDTRMIHSSNISRKSIITGEIKMNNRKKQSDAFSQTNFCCRLEWGRDGAKLAAARGDIVVIVDTLSFSTTVVTAIHNGALIYPCSDPQELNRLTSKYNCEKAVHRDDVPSKGRYSLSPETFRETEPDTRVSLMSLNGGACCRYADKAEELLIGSFINAEAVANRLFQLLDKGNAAVTVVACGERWQMPMEDGALRFAVEDYLAAGAILSYLIHDKSPEARVCQAAYNSLENNIDDILWECTSGRELRAAGFSHDVEFAAQMNLYNTLVVMKDDYLDGL